MHENLFTYALGVFMGFFAIMNPIANTPIFIALTGEADKETKRKIARSACITAFLIVVAFIILGKYIFAAFGITIPAFKVTGGILLFFIGFQMVESKQTESHDKKVFTIDKDIAISPLAIPILAGPGTIVTAMGFITNYSGYVHIGIVIAIFALMIFLTYLAFKGSQWIMDKIGRNLILVIGKIMGLILAIMGVRMIGEGIKMAFNLK